MQQSSAPFADVLCNQLEVKRCVVDEHRKSIFINSLLPLLFSFLHRSVLSSSEPGSSSWLKALPLIEHGFAYTRETEHGFAYTREPFGMPCVLGMVGNHLCYHQVVLVESDLLLSMLWDVHVVVILP